MRLGHKKHFFDQKEYMKHLLTKFPRISKKPKIPFKGEKMSVKLIIDRKKVTTRLSPIRPQAEEFLGGQGYVQPLVFSKENGRELVQQLKIGKDNLFSF